MSMVAGKLGKPVEELRELNMYQEGDKTHFGQALQDWNVPTLWQQIKKSSDFDRRRAEVDEFNAQNRWKKRGLAMMPTKFGISFTALMLNVSCLLALFVLNLLTRKKNPSAASICFSQRAPARWIYQFVAWWCRNGTSVARFLMNSRVLMRDTTGSRTSQQDVASLCGRAWCAAGKDPHHGDQYHDYGQYLCDCSKRC